MDEFRYHDEARKLGESLATIELTPERPPRGGALEAIANNKTAFSDHEASREAAIASVPVELQKAEMRRKLHQLLASKHQKTAARELVLDSFTREARKLANPMGPDVSASAMTSGGGGPPEKPEPDPSRSLGGHQGPAANLFARGLKELNEGPPKTAASRLDKEVRLGNVGYHDVDPSIPKALGNTGYGKYVSRTHAFEPTAAPNLAQRQNLLDRSHNAHIGTNNIVGTHLPNVGPATDGRMAFGQPKVHAPKSSGGFMRSAGKGLWGRLRAQLGTHDEKFLPKAVPSDKTTGRAILGHELAERQEMARSGTHGVHLHASHMGVRPILEENMHARGDPGSVKALQAVRRGHPDDALVARLSKQIGHHPDAPLPIGGKHERALEKRLAASSGQLHGGTKLKTIQGALNTATQHAKHVAAQGGSPEEIQQAARHGIGLFKTIPKHMQDEVANFHGTLSKAQQGMQARGSGLVSKARGLMEHAPPVLGGLRRLSKVKW